MADSEALEHLNAVERRCVQRFVATLVERLGDNLVEVRLFGSAARGDMWRFMPITSDIDLLVLMREPLSASVQEELINETYPLYLECGRQIGPQWRTVEQWDAPRTEREREFKANVESEGRKLFVAA